MQLGPMVLTPPLPTLGRVAVPASRRGSLLIDDEAAGEIMFKAGFTSLISWSGLDIGRDRASPVSHYAAPFEFSGRLFKVTVTLEPQHELDGAAVGNAEMARQ
jgi:arylsulfatase